MYPPYLYRNGRRDFNFQLQRTLSTEMDFSIVIFMNSLGDKSYGYLLSYINGCPYKLLQHHLFNY